MFTPHALRATLDRSLPPQASGALCVAFSGGLDSTVLLHALRAEWTGPLRAVYVDHGLQAASSSWGERCRQSASALCVDCMTLKVDVRVDPLLGPEAAARGARYDALRRHLAPGEVLLTAHHADDQVETLLLALLRGSGVQGLAGMPACREFGAGWHVRPLLQFSRSELERYAMSNRLHWIDDPSNAQVDFDRNYLRHEVVPALSRRWPALPSVVARSTRHLAEAIDTLDQVARDDLQSCALGDCLRVNGLQALTAARRRNLLRYWLRSHGARMPPTRMLASLEHDVFAARYDASLRVRWDDFEVRRHRGLLYALRQLPPIDVTATLPWLTESLELPGQLGELHWESSTGAGISLAPSMQSLHVAFRRGGEVLHIAGRAHRRPLKKILQDENVLPWWRDRLPLVFSGKRLVAVANLWHDAAFAARPGELSRRIVWSGAPAIFAKAAPPGPA